MTKAIAMRREQTGTGGGGGGDWKGCVLPQMTKPSRVTE